MSSGRHDLAERSGDGEGQAEPGQPGQQRGPAAEVLRRGAAGDLDGRDPGDEDDVVELAGDHGRPGQVETGRRGGGEVEDVVVRRALPVRAGSAVGHPAQR